MFGFLIFFFDLVLFYFIWYFYSDRLFLTEVHWLAEQRYIYVYIFSCLPILWDRLDRYLPVLISRYRSTFNPTKRGFEKPKETSILCGQNLGRAATNTDTRLKYQWVVRIFAVSGKLQIQFQFLNSELNTSTGLNANRARADDNDQKTCDYDGHGTMRLRLRLLLLLRLRLLLDAATATSTATAATATATVTVATAADDCWSSWLPFLLMLPLCCCCCCYCDCDVTALPTSTFAASLIDNNVRALRSNLIRCFRCYCYCCCRDSHCVCLCQLKRALFGCRCSSCCCTSQLFCTFSYLLLFWLLLLLRLRRCSRLLFFFLFLHFYQTRISLALALALPMPTILSNTIVIPLAHTCCALDLVAAALHCECRRHSDTITN